MSPAEQSGNVTSVRGKNHLKLRIFHSFEEQEAAEIADLLTQSPMERIRETVALILRVYGIPENELIKRREKLHLTIIKKA